MGKGSKREIAINNTFLNYVPAYFAWVNKQPPADSLEAAFTIQLIFMNCTLCKKIIVVSRFVFMLSVSFSV